jgi:Kef-type K+ transport system membrane component KefB
MSLAGVLSLLLLQIVAILLVTYTCGWVLARLGQPRVVGEITGGLLLGPLVLGHMFPVVSSFLFSPSRLHSLEIVSNIGLVLFLFVIGAEVDLAAVRENRRASFAITAGSIALPFVLGVGLSPFLFARFGVEHASRLGFFLFTGIAMSITALPVLARLIQERSITSRPIDSVLAATALLCAAANDLIAWSLLALTLAVIHGDQGGNSLGATFLRLLTLAAYVGIMILLVRPLAARLFASRNRPAMWLWFPAMVGFAFLSAHITELLSVHAFFGAFLAGVCVPRVKDGGKPLDQRLQEMLQPILLLALPVFFAMTGLRMQREMFSGEGLGWFGVVLVAAVVGKIGGTMLGARSSGMQWKMATQLGVLLNTRGLVELVVLNVGYKEGILSPLLFTIFVVMAIVTTAITVPLFDLSDRLMSRGRPSLAR